MSCRLPHWDRFAAWQNIGKAGIGEDAAYRLALAAALLGAGITPRELGREFSEYVHAANYAVGIYMAGAGYGYMNPSPLPKPMLSSIHRTHLTTNIKDANGK